MANEAWFDPIIDILYDYLDVLEEVEQEHEAESEVLKSDIN